MQDKQKVTLYLPPDLHRQLKISSAVKGEAMSALAERAIGFYLSHGEAVEHLEGLYGHTHEVHACPSCSSPLVLREGELVSLRQSSVEIDDDLSVDAMRELVGDPQRPEEEQEELVPC